MVLLSILERMPGWRGINKANDLFVLCVSCKNWEEKIASKKKKIPSSFSRMRLRATEVERFHCLSRVILDVPWNKLIWGPNICNFNFGNGRSAALAAVAKKRVDIYYRLRHGEKWFFTWIHLPKAMIVSEGNHKQKENATWLPSNPGKPREAEEKNN